jgi:predicted ATPase
MLQTIREYAREQLAASGETKAIEDRHARYFLDLARHMREGSEGGDQVGWIARGALEEGDIWIVLERLLARRSRETSRPRRWACSFAAIFGSSGTSAENT